MCAVCFSTRLLPSQRELHWRSAHADSDGARCSFDCDTFVLAMYAMTCRAHPSTRMQQARRSAPMRGWVVQVPVWRPHFTVSFILNVIQRVLDDPMTSEFAVNSQAWRMYNCEYGEYMDCIKKQVKVHHLSDG